MASTQQLAASAAFAVEDPCQDLLEMLTVFARVHSRGGFVVAECISPHDKKVVESVLDELADLAEHLPEYRKSRIH